MGRQNQLRRVTRCRVHLFSPDFLPGIAYKPFFARTVARIGAIYIATRRFEIRAYRLGSRGKRRVRGVNAARASRSAGALSTASACFWRASAASAGCIRQSAWRCGCAACERSLRARSRNRCPRLLAGRRSACGLQNGLSVFFCQTSGYRSFGRAGERAVLAVLPPQTKKKSLDVVCVELWLDGVCTAMRACRPDGRGRLQGAMGRHVPRRRWPAVPRRTRARSMTSGRPSFASPLASLPSQT